MTTWRILLGALTREFGAATSETPTLATLNVEQPGSTETSFSDYAHCARAHKDDHRRPRPKAQEAGGWSSRGDHAACPDVGLLPLTAAGSSSARGTTGSLPTSPATASVIHHLPNRRHVGITLPVFLSRAWIDSR